MQDLNPPFYLVALPSMLDPQFVHAVILVAHHDENGAFGLILNQALRDEDDHPAQMTAEVKDVAGNTLFIFSEDIFRGGPVGGGSLFALHEQESLGKEETSLGQELFLATDPETFQRLLEHDSFRNKRRFFMGYSSWAAGQLEAEIRSGSWIMVPYGRQHLFDAVPKNDPHWTEHFWRKILLQSGLDPLTLIPQGGGSSDPGYN